MHCGRVADPSAEPVLDRHGELRAMESKSTGRKYDLYIRKPADYDKEKDKKYPVLYLLDGHPRLEGDSRIMACAAVSPSARHRGPVRATSGSRCLDRICGPKPA
jgi:predicted alpha/beta superfamily hydrolase